MAKTWDTSRTGGGTYEFSQDSQGRYTLNSIGFKGINKLDLPKLKTEAATTTTAATPKKDIAALSAQTTQAFGDVQPFYYDKEGKTEDPKYITMRKEDDDRPKIPTTTAAWDVGKWGPRPDDTKPMTTGAGPWTMRTGKADTIPKWAEDADRGRWSADVTTTKPEEVTQVGRQNVNEILAKKAEADKIKKVERFPPGQQFGPQKISPYQDAIMRGETGVKEGIKPDKGFIQKIIPQKVKDTMQKINKGTTFLRTAAGIVGGPFVSGAAMLMGVVKETPQNKHDKQYFNADREGGRISGNPTTDLYAGMNRVSLKGNLESAGAKRIATREKAIAKGNVSQKFINDTNNMRDQQNNYRKSKNEAAVKEAVKKGADVSNPAEMSAATGGGGGNGGGKGIICTQMYQQTKLEDWKKTMQLWYIFQKKYLTIEHQEGYHFLFKPFVKGMKKSKILTAIGKYCAIARTKDLKHIMFGTSFSFTGRLVRLISEPICYLTGKIKSWL